MAGRHELRPEGPVFVDPSGRRSRVVRVIGWVLALLLVSYLLLVAVALVGPPGLSRVTVPGVGPVLPGPGAARLDDGGSEREAPQAVLERTPSPTPSPRVDRTPPPQPTNPPATAPPTAPATPAATTSPGGPGADRPTQAASPAATETPRRTGPPSPQPARSEPPGATRRPTRSPS